MAAHAVVRLQERYSDITRTLSGAPGRVRTAVRPATTTVSSTNAESGRLRAGATNSLH